MYKKYILVLGCLFSSGSASSSRFVRILDNPTLGQAISAAIEASQTATKRTNVSKFDAKEFMKRFPARQHSFEQAPKGRGIKRISDIVPQKPTVKSGSNNFMIPETEGTIKSVRQIIEESKIKLTPFEESFIKDTQKQLPAPRTPNNFIRYTKQPTELKIIESGSMGDQAIMGESVVLATPIIKSGLPALVAQAEPTIIKMPRWKSSIRFASSLKKVAKKIVKQVDPEQATIIATLLTTMVGFLLVEKHFNQQEMSRMHQIDAEQLLLLKSTLGEFDLEENKVDNEQVVTSLVDIAVSAEEALPTENDDKVTIVDFIVDHVTNVIFKMSKFVNNIELPTDLTERITSTATLLFDHLYTKGAMTTALLKQVVTQTALSVMQEIEDFKMVVVIETAAVHLFINQLLSGVEAKIKGYTEQETMDNLTMIASTVLDNAIDLPNQMKEMSSQMVLNAMMTSLQIIVENVPPQHAVYIISGLLNDEQRELFIDAYGALASESQRSDFITLLTEHNEAVKIKNALYSMNEQEYTIDEITASLEKVLMTKTFTQEQKSMIVQKVQELFATQSDVLDAIDRLLQKEGYALPLRAE